MTPTPLTVREAETLAHLKAYIAAHGHSPTLESLALLDGVSKVTVFERVNGLERKGWITRQRYKSNSIRVLGKCPTCGAQIGGGE